MEWVWCFEYYAANLLQIMKPSASEKPLDYCVFTRNIVDNDKSSQTDKPSCVPLDFANGIPLNNRLKVLWAITYTTARQHDLFHFVLYKSIMSPIPLFIASHYIRPYTWYKEVTPYPKSDRKLSFQELSTGNRWLCYKPDEVRGKSTTTYQ